MLLDRERTRVDRDTKDFDVGDDARPETTEGEGEQLGDNLEEAHADARISISDRARSPQ